MQVFKIKLLIGYTYIYIYKSMSNSTFYYEL